MGREGHLGVGVSDEGIHHDHDQDRDRNPEVPNDPSQLRAGGGASGQCPVASHLPPSTWPHSCPIFTRRHPLFSGGPSTSNDLSCASTYLPPFLSPWPAAPWPHSFSTPFKELSLAPHLGPQPGCAEKAIVSRVKSYVMRGPAELGIGNGNLG